MRELLDKKCLVLAVTTDKFQDMLDKLHQPPKLIIRDSQVFGTIYEQKPKESMLTSFSVLFAAYKGDIQYYIEGAKAIDRLTENSKILIAECCTHAPLEEDIGRVKIPAALRKRYGAELQIDMVAGADFPKDLSQYDLVIHCGACMFNKKHVMSRIEQASEQNTSITNYGVTLAKLAGILDKVDLGSMAKVKNQ
jgi:[FeFe] hydrogenase H-cluster maturation GTPase HydF